MRGKIIENGKFLDNLKVVDDKIIDMCPSFDKFEKEYRQKFI